MKQAMLLGRISLRFATRQRDLPQELSAAVQGPGGALWVASDEPSALERLSTKDPRAFGEHTRFPLSHSFPLPAGAVVDLSALHADASALWFVGAHAARRGKGEGDAASAGSRLVLGRLPLNGSDPVKAEGKPSKRAAAPALVAQDKAGVSELAKLLSRDEHLGPFLSDRPAPKAAKKKGGLVLPSTGNGFEVRGLAVRDDRVFLGLRGPVVGGHAVLLEVKLQASGGDLTPVPLKKGVRYRKQFLNLDGLGIRSLAADGDDLLVLAGPTTALDGPVRLFRLVNGLELTKDGVIQQRRGRLEYLFDVPNGEGCDHAEGVSVYSYFEEADSVLVVYHRPDPRRRVPMGVLADVLRLR